MIRVLAFVLAVMCLLWMTGCGGSSGGNQFRGISIQDGGLFFPTILTVNAGNDVQWVNRDTISHQIQSGILSKTTSPVVLDPIGIQPNSTFAPDTKEADYGDTVRWVNNTDNPFTLEIIDNSGNVITTINFAANGDIHGFENFPSAGRYIYQQQNFPLFFGTLTLFGVPNPNGIFQSPLLGTGGTFTRQFTTVGQFPYYSLDQQHPNRSFASGTIVVQ